jgi:hypothetical protein
MPANGLPGDGALRVGQVSLPAGRRVGGGGSRGPVAWVTDGLVEDPGLIWSELSRDSAVTGLVPFLAATLEEEGSRARVAESLALADGAGFGSDHADDEDEDDGDDEDGGPFGARGRPWDNGEFDDPEEVTAGPTPPTDGLARRRWPGWPSRPARPPTSAGRPRS